MPRSRSDVTLVSVGRLWAERVVPLKQLFIDSGMPQDFIEKLNAAIENVQRTIQNQTQSNSARLEDAIAIQHTRGQAVAALRRLDPIMHNLLRDDPPVLAVWQRARRVERSNGARPAQTEASPPARTDVGEPRRRNRRPLHCSGVLTAAFPVLRVPQYKTPFPPQKPRFGCSELRFSRSKQHPLDRNHDLLGSRSRSFVPNHFSLSLNTRLRTQNSPLSSESNSP